jgi:hypothetical protein
MPIVNFYLLSMYLSAIYHYCPPFALKTFLLFFLISNWLSSPLRLLASVCSLEMEETERLNCVTSFIRTDWLRMTSELMNCPRISAPSGGHPLCLSFKPLGLALKIYLCICTLS